MRKQRLNPVVFNLPIDKIKNGWYSDKYFVRTKTILKLDGKKRNVLMQVFSRGDGILCGIDEAIAVLRLCADKPEELKIKALYDGDEIKDGETVMTIEGDYSTFAHLETVYLGVISRPTAIATSVKKVIDAAEGRQVLFFPARFTHYRIQATDGYAAYVAGATGVSTDANGEWWGGHSLGTIPHALIAAYNGDTVQAAIVFDKYMPEDIKRIVLVDFDNDCIGTSLKVLRALGKKVWGVRFDTSGSMIDKSVEKVIDDPYIDNKTRMGVCPELCRMARKVFDEMGYKDVKIIISGGFNVEKIKRFIDANIPFDAVGVGSSLFKDSIDFTADIVQLNGKHCAKIGRKYNPNLRLEIVE